MHCFLAFILFDVNRVHWTKKFRLVDPAGMGREEKVGIVSHRHAAMWIIVAELEYLRAGVDA
jgi:hypothetical protein